MLIAGYYLVSKQQVWVDDMFVMTTTGRYWFRNGYNPNAVAATIIGGVPAIAMVLTAGVVFGDSENMLLSPRRRLQLVRRLRTRLPLLLAAGEVQPQDHRPGRRDASWPPTGPRSSQPDSGPGQGRRRQRKPRCPVEVSSVWPCRAAGR